MVKLFQLCEKGFCLILLAGNTDKLKTNTREIAVKKPTTCTSAVYYCL